MLTGSSEEIARTISEHVNSSKGIIDFFNKEIVVAEFLQRRLNAMDWRTHPVVPEIYDFGAMFAITGKHSYASDCLLRCRDYLKGGGNPGLASATEQLPDALEGPDDLIAATIEDIEIRSMCILGIAPGSSAA
jgi:hypothetical protein